MWSVHGAVSVAVLRRCCRGCGVAAGVAVLQRCGRCRGFAVGVAELRRYCRPCCGVVVRRVAVSVAVLWSVSRCGSKVGDQ